MKKTILILCIAFVALGMNAENMDKTYKRYIQNYDADFATRLIDPDQPHRFWEEMLTNNEALLKFRHKMEGNGGLERTTRQEAAILPRFYPQYDQAVVPELQKYCDSLFATLEVDSLGINCRLYAVNSPDVSTFSSRTDDGYAIMITTALMGSRGMTDDILRGLVANEFVHVALDHPERLIYEALRDERNRRRTANILTAVVVSLDVLDYVANDNQPYYETNLYYDTYLWNELRARAAISTQRYMLRYQAAQVYEADLIAFRFMQNIGQAEDYLNGLRLLGANTPQDNPDPAQPTTFQRLAFLDYVLANPELYNTKNPKMGKHRAGSRYYAGGR